MDERLTPDELRSLLGAFALGAVNDAERVQVEQFVLDDRDARAELHQLEHAVAWLGHASPRPHSESWDAVRAEIDADLLTDEEPAPGVVVPFTSFESRRTTHGWRRLTAVAAAAVIFVGTAVAVARIIDHDSSVTPTRTVALRAPGGATAVVAKIGANGDGAIDTSDLPIPSAGHVYQLWAQPTAMTPMHSAGVLGRSPGGRHIRIPTNSVRIAISVEPDGGSRAPTTKPVAISDLGAL